MERGPLMPTKFEEKTLLKVIFALAFLLPLLAALAGGSFHT